MVPADLFIAENKKRKSSDRKNAKNCKETDQNLGTGKKSRASVRLEMCGRAKSSSGNQRPQMKKDLYNLRIRKLHVQAYGILQITLSDNSEYIADLGPEFSQLFCY